jgi:hypothetical protein
MNDEQELRKWAYTAATETLKANAAAHQAVGSKTTLSWNLLKIADDIIDYVKNGSPKEPSSKSSQK